jgi:hypothetical protein
MILALNCTCAHGTHVTTGNLSPELSILGQMRSVRFSAVDDSEASVFAE